IRLPEWHEPHEQLSNRILRLDQFESVQSLGQLSSYFLILLTRSRLRKSNRSKEHSCQTHLHKCQSFCKRVQLNFLDEFCISHPHRTPKVLQYMSPKNPFFSLLLGNRANDNWIPFLSQNQLYSLFYLKRTYRYL